MLALLFGDRAVIQDKADTLIDVAKILLTFRVVLDLFVTMIDKKAIIFVKNDLAGLRESC